MNTKNRLLSGFIFELLSYWPAIALSVLSGFTIGFAAESPSLPPIVLISVDTLRADHLSCYGYHGQSTPHIDAMAQGGDTTCLPKRVGCLAICGYGFAQGRTTRCATIAF